MSEPNFDTFIEELKAAPSFVKENVMCYFYHNSSACTKCHKENCKAREPREIPPAIDELTQSDKMEAYKFLVRIGEYRALSIPNPNLNYALFCYTIRDIATGKYMKEIEEVVIDPVLDERTRKWIKELRSLTHAKHSDDDDAVALAMAGERYRKEFEMEPVLDIPLPKFCIAHHCTERGPKCDKCAYTAFSSSHRRRLEA